MRIGEHRVAFFVLSLATLGVTMGAGMEGCMPTLIPAGSVSFSKDIQPIFDAKCISCHAPGGMADEVMHLVAEHAYDALIPRAEEHDAAMEGMDGMDGDGDHHDMDHAARVVPGDSANSFLYQKVSMDSPPKGARMPLGGPPLSDAEIALIRNWIDQGAPRN